VRVALNRALSKLGILSRARATETIRAGRVRVDGRLVTDPAARVEPERVRIIIDGEVKRRAAWRTLLFHKPRGVLTTRSDPEGRPTIYDVLGEEGRGLVPIGRLDMATSGLLLLTTDTRFAEWITNPEHAVPRVYAVTVGGRVDRAGLVTLAGSLRVGRERLRFHRVELRKSSTRESHLVVELREGKNREVRRLFEAAGYEVTRLKRVRFGSFELGDLQPSEWREVSREETRLIRIVPEAEV